MSFVVLVEKREAELGAFLIFLTGESSLPRSFRVSNANVNANANANSGTKRDR
jgi:hypothetical protein